MALIAAFQRFGINHGDSGTWWPMIAQLLRMGGIGALNFEMYNNGGALWLTKGFSGINNGVSPTGEGAVEVTTAGDLATAAGYGSFVGLTTGQWQQVEESVSGTSVTFHITSMGASYTDESTIPANIKAAYDYTKQAYHLSSSKRLIGCFFLRIGPVLGRIVNCESGKFGFKGITIEDYIDAAGVRSIKYKAKETIETGPWNMYVTGGGTSSKLEVTLPFTAPNGIILRSASIMVIDDTGATLKPLNSFVNAADPQLVNGGLQYLGISGASLNKFGLYIRTGGIFDTTSYNDAVINRAWIDFIYET